MFSSLHMQDKKSFLRKKYLKIRHDLAMSQRSLAARTIIQQLLQLNCIKQATRIAGYCPIKQEVDLCALYLHSANQNKHYVLPIRHNQSLVMTFAPWRVDRMQNITLTNLTALEQNVNRNAIFAMKSLLPDVILVPGLAFDRNLYRLGYGKGYYDATIRHLRNAKHQFVTIGIAFSVQIATNLPKQDWDEPLDYVLTEQELYSYH